MTDAPKRIQAAATRWAYGHGPDIDWRKGQWGIRSVMDVSQEYVRADIADDMLATLKSLDSLTASDAAKVCAAIAKAEGGEGSNTQATPKVKALEWEESGGYYCWPLGLHYYIEGEPGDYYASCMIGNDDVWKAVNGHTVKYMKAQCQADHERRILDALE